MQFLYGLQSGQIWFDRLIEFFFFFVYIYDLQARRHVIY